VTVSKRVKQASSGGGVGIQRLAKGHFVLLLRINLKR